jgi:2-oxoglutarate/2-oxoacid ferredoxin oxidoreductase subunit beta
VATGIKLVNPALKVIAVGGDGDGYAEGGNHIIHAARRNVEVTYMIHNNQIYGLTKGQMSPTTDLGSPTTSYHNPNGTRPLNPLRLLLGTGASFVARGFAGDKEQLAGNLKQALQHRGFACIDILQPCVVFNKVNTFKWYRDRVYDVNKEGTARGPGRAFRLAGEWGEKIPTGVFFAEKRETLNQALLGGEESFTD